MEEAERVRVLLVDDHALFLTGMTHFLQTQGFEVTATARNGAEALLKYEMTQPHLVLMDLQMTNGDGIESTRLLKKEYPAATIIMLTACEDETSLFQAMKAGASGYLVKGMEPELFLKELDKWRHGDIPLAPGMAGRMLKLLASPPQAAKPQREILTERQIEVLRLVAQGYVYKEIAQKLDVKEVTVKYHIKESMAKLHLANRSELIAYAVQKNLL